MALSFLTYLILAAAVVSSSAGSFAAGHPGNPRAAPVETGPFFHQVNAQTWIIGNELWSLTQGVSRGAPLKFKGRDLVGRANGHYASYNRANLQWTSASIVASEKTQKSSVPFIDVAFTANEGDLHWVIFKGLPGAYQYFVNKGLPAASPSEFRTVWRLDNRTFTHGHNDVRDEPLPPLSDYLAKNKVQDETWLKPKGGGYITKYDFSALVRKQTAYGVYGDGVGSWYINPGKDYYNGNHLKQELMVHRESSSGDVVQLNMMHGIHYMQDMGDSFPKGKMWGPWLWYLNDGDAKDAEARAQEEERAWPYAWVNDKEYHQRGTVVGQLKLSDGRPAAKAAVFLGENNPQKSSLDMGSDYYYTAYADDQGKFKIDHVREGVYGFQAWSNGGAIADVTTSFLQNDVAVKAGQNMDLGAINWAISKKTKLFQVGEFDRAAYGFKFGGAPYSHALHDNCPANLVYTIGSSKPEDWCFAQTAIGKWTVKFQVAKNAKATGATATLIMSLAGYSSGRDMNILVNDKNKVGTVTGATKGLQNDPSLYRSSTVGGEWHYLEFTFDAKLLSSGWNTVTFEVYSEKADSKWHGMMWDSIVLEW